MAEEGAGMEGIRLPATASVYYFSELSEVLPTGVAYAHNGELFWSLGHFHDNLHGLLGGEAQLEPLKKFVQVTWKKLTEDEVVRHLGASMYRKPSAGSDRPGKKVQQTMFRNLLFEHCMCSDKTMFVAPNAF